MTTLIAGAKRLHDSVFHGLFRLLDGWFTGLVARFAFAAVLLVYFLNSARTKVGDGIAGFFSVSDNAYYQIALPAVEAAGGDVAQVAFLPWGLMVRAGTYAEFILPVLIVLGLFTRLAALGMMAFVAVQTMVDITVHRVGAETVGAWFDRFSDATIADQRLLWIVALAILVVHGAGCLSLDHVLSRWWSGASEARPLAQGPA